MPVAGLWQCRTVTTVLPWQNRMTRTVASLCSPPSRRIRLGILKRDGDKGVWPTYRLMDLATEFYAFRSDY